MSSPPRSIPLQLFLFLSLLSFIAASRAIEHSHIGSSDEFNNVSIANERNKVGDSNQNQGGIGGGGGGGGPNGGGGGGGGGGGYGWGWGGNGGGGGGGGGAGGGGGSGYGNASGGNGTGYSDRNGNGRVAGRSGNGRHSGGVRSSCHCSKRRCKGGYNGRGNGGASAGNSNDVQTKHCRRKHHRGHGKARNEKSAKDYGMQGQNQERKLKGSFT